MGPLAGVKIVEFTGIGPAPMAAMLLADMGATVLRIDRVAPADLGVPMAEEHEFTRRSRAVLNLDLKQPAAIALALRLIDGADALIEGFRPGVMERLGLGPDVCLGRNPKLAYGRVTGWGQEGPLAQAAGHDLNYIALTGALHAIGRAGTEAHAAVEPGGRLRRRRALSGDRVAGGDHLGPHDRGGAGGRCRDGRWRAVVDDPDLCHAGRRPDDRATRREQARFRRLFLRGV